MANRRENPIPVEHRQAVYFLGLDPKEIVSVREISVIPHVFDVHLRWGGKEWHGHIPVPSYGPRPPVIRLADLISHTKDCEHCGGSGKVPRD
jgi:hypothetical protein